MHLSIFRGYTDSEPKATTLQEVVRLIRDDASVRDLTEKHRYYLSVGDDKSARQCKSLLPCFAVAVRFSGGKQMKHITGYTGLSIVDIDHIDPARMAGVLAIVKSDPHTLLAYTTVSGRGVRVLVKYVFNDNENPRATLGTPPSQSDTHDPVVQGTALPSLSTAWHLANPLKASFAINRGGASSTPTHPEGMQSTNCPSVYRGTSGTQCSGGSSKHSAEQHKLAFLTINEYYHHLTGHDTDLQCKNATRLSGIAHDPTVYYTPDAEPFVISPTPKRPVGRPKKGKSEEGRVKRCEAAVLRDLERRGVVYAPGSHNRYISEACYMMNRYGVPEADCTDWALDRFADYQAAGNDVAGIVSSCYRHTEEHATLRPSRADKETFATVREIQDYLTAKGIRIRHNVISRKWEILVEGSGSRVESRLRDVTLPDGNSLNTQTKFAGRGEKQPSTLNSEALGLSKNYQELTDRHVNSIYRAFSLDTGRRLRISDLYIIIESDFYPVYNPFHEYLRALPQWDGTDHIEALASTVHVIGSPQEMHNRYFKKWFVAMVAAWLDDDITNHEILTYIGPQGIYKSTFMRRLLPPELRGYFSARNFAHRMSKDDRLELTEMGLIALEELDHMKDYELNQLKAVTTDPSVNERAAYAHFRERRAHIASFCGTGNNPRFLTDLTGNRRWLPFIVSSIDSPYEHPFPYEGLYAQAYALLCNHFAYWLNDTENAELEQHNRHFEEPNIEEELILTYLRKPYGGEVGEFLTATRIIELIGSYIKTQLSARHVTMTMKRLGFEQRRTSTARGWNVVILTGDDIKNNQRQAAHQSSVEQ